MNERKAKLQRIYKIIMLLILTIVITFTVTTLFIYKEIKNMYTSEILGDNVSSDEIGLLKTLENFKSILEAKYIGEINEEDLIEGALKGYVAGLGDPYTEYLGKSEMEDFNEETSSQYVGIGVYVSNINNQIYVAGVMEGSPAEEAGIKAEDIIKKIDGVEYKGEELEKATAVLKDEEGTTVNITIERDGEELNVQVTRKKIKVEHVSSEMLENDIAYLQIDSFDSGVASSFKEKALDLINKGAKKIIIDLRNNGGGIVSEATDIADLFVEKDKTILITKGKGENDEKLTKAKIDPVIKDIPLVILVNENTASASEILAGALKELYGAKIVGKTTYGKGVIQTVYTLSDGSGLKITTDEYYTPNHNQINKVGIKPDYEVDLTSYTEDTQLNKAIEVLNK